MPNAIRITKSRDPNMWYAGKVGEIFPLLGQWPEGYKSREPAGYVNVVRYEDAEIVQVDHNGTITPNLAP